MDSNPIYRSILNSMTEQVYVRDMDKNLLFMNAAAEDLTGWTFEDARKKKCYEVFGDGKGSCKNTCPVDRAIEKQETIVHHEGELQCRSGKIRKMQVSITPILEKESNAAAVVVMQDITEFQTLQETHVKTLIALENEVKTRRESERMLQKANETLMQERGLFVSGPVVVFHRLNEPGWPVTYVSSNVRSVMGYSAQSLLDGTIRYTDIIHPEDLNRVEEEVRHFTEQNHSYFEHMPYRVVTADANLLWLMDYTTIMRDENGRATGYLGYIVDITRWFHVELALKKKEKVLRNNEERLSASLSEKKRLLEELHDLRGDHDGAGERCVPIQE